MRLTGQPEVLFPNLSKLKPDWAEPPEGDVMRLTGQPEVLLYLLVFRRVFHFPCHEPVGVRFKNTLAGAGAEKDASPLVQSAGIFLRIVNSATANR